MSRTFTASSFQWHMPGRNRYLANHRCTYCTVHTCHNFFMTQVGPQRVTSLQINAILVKKQLLNFLGKKKWREILRRIFGRVTKSCIHVKNETCFCKEYFKSIVGFIFSQNNLHPAREKIFMPSLDCSIRSQFLFS